MKIETFSFHLFSEKTSDNYNNLLLGHELVTVSIWTLDLCKIKTTY